MKWGVFYLNFIFCINILRLLMIIFSVLEFTFIHDCSARSRDVSWWNLWFCDNPCKLLDIVQNIDLNRYMKDGI